MYISESRHLPSAMLVSEDRDWQALIMHVELNGKVALKLTMSPYSNNQNVWLCYARYEIFMGEPCPDIHKMSVFNTEYTWSYPPNVSAMFITTALANFV